jgi:hypothetical protein
MLTTESFLLRLLSSHDANISCGAPTCAKLTVSFGFDCALHDSVAPQDAQAETTARRIRITNDVPILRIDHISIETMLLGVWQVSYKRECDPDSREMNRWLHFFTRATPDFGPNWTSIVLGEKLNDWND